MATTSPDNLFSPDANSQYALTQDLALAQDSVQRALNKRANLYTGTASERVAAASVVSEGALWQDTNGDNVLWRKTASGWVSVSGERAWSNVPVSWSGGFSGSVSGIRRFGWVELRIGTTSGSIGTGNISLFTITDPTWAPLAGATASENARGEAYFTNQATGVFYGIPGSGLVGVTNSSGASRATVQGVLRYPTAQF